jgi:hypothetical protein
MSETERYVQGIIKNVCGLESHGERPHRAGDYSFNNIGISSFFMLSSTMPDDLRAAKGYYAVGGCGGNIAWHTENDTLEIADKEILLRDIKVYLASILGVANAEILPFDWRATVEEFTSTLANYATQAGGAFDFSEAQSALDAFKQTLEGFYAKASSGGIEPSKANAVIMGLARILVPINFTVAPRFRHDPATPVQPLPTLAVANDIAAMDLSVQGFARVQLTRGANRFIAALREAERLVRAA